MTSHPPPPPPSLSKKPPRPAERCGNLPSGTAAARLPHFALESNRTLFLSTVSVQKLRRFNTLIPVFQFAAFCSSAAASVFMLVNPWGPDSPRWYDFDAISLVFSPPSHKVKKNLPLDPGKVINSNQHYISSAGYDPSGGSSATT
ncbi:hypothetical protein RHGRI_005071 [Rhododendron griersonianum]|uniref:Uncharacterized protein n=1 Tax=Rhododendron griersonianum TaxID=479676 RepID=A0AAV6LDL4_9ERIC|nr:hypothetical protein RHGRI_005071 [Rhododendron griersonianum]